jgi:hypothetical protein
MTKTYVKLWKLGGFRFGLASDWTWGATKEGSNSLDGRDQAEMTKLRVPLGIMSNTYQIDNAKLHSVGLAVSKIIFEILIWDYS